MPNHIKNRIELIGQDADIKEFVERFSTFYPTVPSTTYDGRLIFEGKEKYSFGWLDESTNVFTRRNTPDHIGIPDGYTQSFDKEWTRFPDFEKVFPVPESIKAVGDSVNSSIVDAVKQKYFANVSTNALLATLELTNRARAIVKPEEQEQFELACKAFEETGFAYWYDWQSEIWGTKWNAYDCEKSADNIFTFDTAWSGVVRIVKELSRHFKGVIRYKFADEDTGCNVGEYKIASNVILFDNRPKNGSKEAYDLAFELHPDRKENYKLVDGNYEYIEED